MLAIAGILCIAPAVGVVSVAGFVSNFALCKLFPVWGNYVTLGVAAVAGTAFAKCIADPNNSQKRGEYDGCLRLVFGSSLGIVLAFLLSLPVGIKVGIAIVVKIVGLLVSYSDT